MEISNKCFLRKKLPDGNWYLYKRFYSYILYDEKSGLRYIGHRTLWSAKQLDEGNFINRYFKSTHGSNMKFLHGCRKEGTLKAEFVYCFKNKRDAAEHETRMILDSGALLSPKYLNKVLHKLPGYNYSAGDIEIMKEAKEMRTKEGRGANTPEQRKRHAKFMKEWWRKRKERNRNVAMGKLRKKQIREIEGYICGQR